MEALTTQRKPQPNVAAPGLTTVACRRCGHHWVPKKPVRVVSDILVNLPRMCPCCGSAYWNAERKRGKKAK